MLEQRIAVTSSMILAIALTTLHSVAAGLLWFTPLPDLGKCVLTLAVTGSLVYYLARDALLHAPHSIVSIEIRDSAVSLQTRRGEWLDGEVLGSSYVSDWLTIVNFRPQGRYATWRVVLVPDNVDATELRRLRTWLLWRRSADSGVISEPEAMPKNLTK